jgi:hypothetical protein
MPNEDRPTYCDESHQKTENCSGSQLDLKPEAAPIDMRNWGARPTFAARSRSLGPPRAEIRQTRNMLSIIANNAKSVRQLEALEFPFAAIVNLVGKAISATNLSRRAFKERLAAAGLGNIRFQDLRHSHATLLLTLGVNPKVIQERLGHEGVKTTLDFYAHVLPSSQQSAAVLTGHALHANTPLITPSQRADKRGETKKP